MGRYWAQLTLLSGLLAETLRGGKNDRKALTLIIPRAPVNEGGGEQRRRRAVPVVTERSITPNVALPDSFERCEEDPEPGANARLASPPQHPAERPAGSVRSICEAHTRSENCDSGSELS